MYLPPGGLDQVLLAVGDPQVAALVDLAHVTRRQPAVGVEDLVGLVGQAVVAAHDAGPAHQDLAVGRDPHLGAGDRRPDPPEDRVLEPHDAGSGAGLGQPVALEDHHPGSVEPVRDVRGQGRAAGDQEPDPSAQPVADLRQDQAVGQDVLGTGQRSWLASLEAGLRDPAPDPERPVEQGALDPAVLLDGLHDLAVHLLEDPRRTCHERRPHLRQVRHDLVHPPVDGGGEADLQLDRLEHLAEGVGQREPEVLQVIG